MTLEQVTSGSGNNITPNAIQVTDSLNLNGSIPAGSLTRHVAANATILANVGVTGDSRLILGQGVATIDVGNSTMFELNTANTVAPFSFSHNVTCPPGSVAGHVMTLGQGRPLITVDDNSLDNSNSFYVEANGSDYYANCTDTCVIKVDNPENVYMGYEHTIYGSSHEAGGDTIIRCLSYPENKFRTQGTNINEINLGERRGVKIKSLGSEWVITSIF